MLGFWKTIFFCSAFFLIRFASIAQTPLGIKGGIQSSALTREGSTLSNESLGFMLGMFFHPVNKHPITGEFEILITRKGVSDARVTYLSVPVLVNIKIADRFFFGAGGFAAAKLADKISVPPNSSGFDLDASFAFVDAGYIFELGYWKKSLEMGIRFERSLTNSFTLNNLNYKNRVWAFYIGYHI